MLLTISLVRILSRVFDVMFFCFFSGFAVVAPCTVFLFSRAVDFTVDVMSKRSHLVGQAEMRDEDFPLTSGDQDAVCLSDALRNNS